MEPEELAKLLKRLRGVQKELGGGQTEDKEAPPNEFMAIKARLGEKVKAIRQDLEDRDRAQQNHDAYQNIVKNKNIRDSLRGLKSDLDDMQNFHSKESRRRKKRYSEEELENMKILLAHYAQQVSDLSVEAQAGFTTANTQASGQMLQGLTREELFKDAGRGGAGSRPAYEEQPLTNDQQAKVEQIDRNDAEIDVMVEEIGDIVADLGDIARAINQEVSVQHEMLENLEEKVDTAANKINDVNDNLKEQLTQRGLGGERMCVNVICFVILLGILGVIYNMLTP